MGGNIWYILHRLVLFHLVSFYFWGNLFLGVSILTVSSVCFLRRWDLGRGNFLECGACANLKAEGPDCWMPFLEDVCCWKKRQRMKRGRWSHDEILWIFNQDRSLAMEDSTGKKFNAPYSKQTARQGLHNLDGSRVHFYSWVVLPGNFQGFMGLQWDTPSQRIVTRRKGGCWIGGVNWCHLTCSFFTNGFCVIPTKMTIWKMESFATIYNSPCQAPPVQGVTIYYPP